MSRAPLAVRNAKEVAVRGEDGGEAGKATPKRLAAVEGEISARRPVERVAKPMK